MDLKKALKKRRMRASELARIVGVSPTHINAVAKDFDYAGEPLQKKIIKALNICHTCHREWPEKIDFNGDGDKGD